MASSSCAQFVSTTHDLWYKKTNCNLCIGSTTSKESCVLGTLFFILWACRVIAYDIYYDYYEVAS